MNNELKAYVTAMDALGLRKALSIAMNVSSIGNSYLQHSEPWELLKTDPERCKTVITHAAQLAKLLISLMDPFIPGFSEKVAYQLNVDVPALPEEFAIDLPAGHALNNVVPLFRQIRAEEVAYFRATYSGNEGGSAGAGAASGDHTAKNTKKKPAGAAGAGAGAAKPAAGSLGAASAL